MPLSPQDAEKLAYLQSKKTRLEARKAQEAQARQRESDAAFHAHGARLWASAQAKAQAEEAQRNWWPAYRDKMYAESVARGDWTTAFHPSHDDLDWSDYE
jgi:hypothetical protein